jgi:hypothetical protein
MSSISPTARSAGSGSQPPACSCARHSSGITADHCLPSGNLAIWVFAQARFSSLKAKVAGWSGSRRRTDMWVSKLD